MFMVVKTEKDQQEIPVHNIQTHADSITIAKSKEKGNALSIKQVTIVPSLIRFVQEGVNDCD